MRHLPTTYRASHEPDLGMTAVVLDTADEYSPAALSLTVLAIPSSMATDPVESLLGPFFSDADRALEIVNSYGDRANPDF